MKILGITTHNSRLQQYMKPDSALLVNSKPFFLPDFSQNIVANPCIVLRISRLGRNIEPRFAHRYYDAWTWGLNIVAQDLIDEASKQGNNYLEGLSFDNSLVVGEMQEMEGNATYQLLQNEELFKELKPENVILPIEDTIANLTQFITIRMGDLIAIDLQNESIPLVAETKWQITYNEQPILSCKIK